MSFEGPLYDCLNMVENTAIGLKAKSKKNFVRYSISTVAIMNSETLGT